MPDVLEVVPRCFDLHLKLLSLRGSWKGFSNVCLPAMWSSTCAWTAGPLVIAMIVFVVACLTLSGSLMMIKRGGCRGRHVLTPIHSSCARCGKEML